MLGRPIDKDDPDTLAFQESMLHDFNMGYYNAATITPHSSVLYIKEENEFVHPWSIKSVCENYAFGKVKELMSLNEYLSWPAFLVEDMLKGLAKGTEARFVLDNPPKGSTPQTKEEKTLADLAKKMGIDLNA